jgi:hypothetical protein
LSRDAGTRCCFRHMALPSIKLIYSSYNQRFRPPLSVSVISSTTSLKHSSVLSDRTQQLGKRPERPPAVQLYQNVPLHDLGNVRLEYLLARLA